MPHLDPDLLALLALGEDVAPLAERAHLDGCHECRARLDSMADAAAIGRTVLDLERPVPPPGRVWDRIAAELDLPPDVRPIGPHQQLFRPSTGHRVGRRFAIGRRPRARMLVLITAVVVLIGAVVGGILIVQRPDEQRTIASATLSHLPGWAGSSGRAQIRQYADGRRVAVITTNLQPTPRHSHEVWLMDAGNGARIELGLLRGSSGTFTVPTTADLRTFSYVDISAEPPGGSPTPSGHSIIRGPLTP